MTLAYPYYTLTTKMTNSYDESVTKSIAGINLPDMSTEQARTAVASDLQAISRAVVAITRNNYSATLLTTREEVT